VMAARLDGFGNVLQVKTVSTQPTSADFNGGCPRIAYGAGVAHVVWQGDDLRVWDVALSSADLSGTPQLLTLDEGYGPDVADSPSADFMVTWSRNSSHDIVAERISSTGALLGPRLLLAGGSSTKESPRLAASTGGATSWMAVWQEGVGSSRNVFAQK